MPATAPATKPFRLRSVFVKATLITAVTTAVVTGTLVYIDHEKAFSMGQSALRETAGMVTNMSGHDAGGALRFNKPDAAADFEREMFDVAGDMLQEVMTLTIDGTVFSQSSAAGVVANPADMQRLGATLLDRIKVWQAERRQASHDEELLFSEDGLLATHPIYFGSDDSIVGVIVTRWSDANVKVTVANSLQSALTLALAVFGVMLAAAALMFRLIISRPLSKLNDAVGQVAEGNFNVAVPSQTATDEIGDIARALEGFRSDLASSVETTRIGMFKGTGFEGASAALLITDPQFCILFANSAARALLALHFPKLARHGDALIAQSVMDLDPALRALSGGGTSQRQHRINLSVGAEALEVAVGPVQDANGGLRGYVVEWRAITQERRNAALMSALDSGQLRAELDLNGLLIGANDRFAGLLGQSAASLAGRSLRGALAFHDPARGDLFSGMRSGLALDGMLRLAQGGQKDALLDTRLNPIVDAKGNVQSYLLLASDVTQLEAERAERERERLMVEKGQANVVDSLRAALARLSDGDLTATLADALDPQYDGLRSDFNLATENLRSALSDVVESSTAIKGEVGEISSAAENLSRRTEQQAATLEQTAAALDQMTASVKLTADVAMHANGKVEEAKNSAETSGHVVREAVAAMSEIEDSSSKISRITSVIDEIAFQTNLLALNAGVEAARAGEAGRGFAVVASEVRDLAQRSSAAAREIAGLITESSDQVKRGVSLVAEAGRSLTGIQHAVGEIHGLVSNIASSAKEQANGIVELNTAVKHLDQVTQQNAAMFEETSAASLSLNRAAETLGATTERFTLQRERARGPSAQQGTTARSWGRPKSDAGGTVQFQSARATPAPHKPPPMKAAVGDSWEDF